MAAFTTVLGMTHSFFVATDEDTPFTFSQANAALLSINDVDVDETAAPNNIVTITLNAKEGELSLAIPALYGLDNTTGRDVTQITFTGTLSEVNQGLVNLVFDPNQDFNNNLGQAELTVTERLPLRAIKRCGRMWRAACLISSGNT